MSRGLLETQPDGCCVYPTSAGWVGRTPWGLRSRPRATRADVLRWLDTERYLQQKREAASAHPRVPKQVSQLAREENHSA